MERWSGKVAIVTGASSGIGAGIAIGLVKNGMIVVGLARRKERIDEIIKDLGSKHNGKLYSMYCDISKEEDILKAFAWVKTNLGGVDVLVNNAAMARQTLLTDPGNSSILKDTVDVNILGLSYCTREAVLSMNARNVNGHIFHINSILGHRVWNIPNLCPLGLNMYPATKFAVTALTETLRLELMLAKSKIKVTSISPGVVDTEIFNYTIGVVAAREFLQTTPHLKPDDISDALIYCLGTSPGVQVHEITIRPVGEAF